MSQVASFDEILDLIESLSDEEQENLIKIIERRQIERRRTDIANNLIQSKEEYKTGQVFWGSVDDIIEQLKL